MGNQNTVGWGLSSVCRTWLCRGLTACISLATPVGVQAEAAAQADIRQSDDARHTALVRFFRLNDSPLASYAADFLSAADRHSLDWRLLPGIAMAESSGGKYFRNGNIFGWNSGKAKFPSVRAAIDYVAGRLARSKHYAGKDMLSIIQAYNPAHKDYPQRVLKHIRRMSDEAIPVSVASAATR